MPDPITFPPTFLWGAATAAYQIEGAASKGGRGDSIWDAFARVPGAVHNGDDGSVACDHYHRYAADVDLMSGLHLRAYRFSVSWARICPDGGEPNPEGLAFYSRLVDALLERDITPWLTLYHWDLPQSLQEAGGWPARETAYRFVDYAQRVHDELGDRVRYWTTLNEPWCSAFLGYGSGRHAPGRTDGIAALRAAHHLMLAHGLAVQELRSRDAGLDLGLTLNFTDIRPANPAVAGDVDAARRIDGLANRFFADPILTGAYPPDVLDDVADLWPADVVRDGDLAIISTPIDVLGVNYYSGQAVTGVAPEQASAAAARERAAGPPSPNPGSEHVGMVPRDLPTTEMGWEILPEGLTELLGRLHRTYTGPRGVALVVTENGAAYADEPDDQGYVDDQGRVDYLRQHLRAVHEAMQEGADVRGYFVWSLLDNYEWALGYSKRFGIVRVDYDTLERTPKASAHWYAEVAATGQVSPVGAVVGLSKSTQP